MENKICPLKLQYNYMFRVHIYHTCIYIYMNPLNIRNIPLMDESNHIFFLILLYLFCF